MKTWGQWREGMRLYSYTINNSNNYRFSHWPITEGWRADWDGTDSLLRDKRTTFYITFIRE